MVKKRLIINADDFGISSVFNSVIIELIKSNFLFATSVMVNRNRKNKIELQKDIKELLHLKSNYNICIGLHLEFKDKHFEKSILVQYEKFKAIYNLIPSHIDIHKGHKIPESHSYVANFCKSTKIPFRNYGKKYLGVKSTSQKAFMGTVDKYEIILDWLDKLEEGGVYEIFFHPGKFDPECKSSFNKIREKDVKYIRDLNQLIASRKNITLTNFNIL